MPWRTSHEGAAENLEKIRYYTEAVERAGGEPVPLSLANPEALASQVADLDGFVLPGSPADVDPAEYGAADGGKCAPADSSREESDRVILGHAFQAHKPVLAICYGCQSLNVYLGGTLVQDIHSEIDSQVAHRKKDLSPEPGDDPRHEVRFTGGSRLASMAGGTKAVVNSSHHQSIAKAGRQLRVTAQASDGVVESIEWTGDANWVIGVQWHPERMRGDALAERLFSELTAAAQGTRKLPPMK